MKTYYKFCLGTIILLLTFIFTIPLQVNAQTTAYPMRKFTMDTFHKTLFLNENATDRNARLVEFSTVNGFALNDWSVKYEHKGSSRGMCEPPVLNITFDKFDSKGKPRVLFTGTTTYSGYSKLQYQEIRLIPECDIWNDYFNGNGDVGFGGQLNVNLREYIIFKIFRKFGIPVTDIIGFANVTFITPDSGYGGKSFRYMIVQRVGEQDDQIPFTTQYNLNTNLYESGVYESSNRPWNIDYNSANRLTGVTLLSNTGGASTSLSFDVDSTIKFLLLTDFLNVMDMGYLHNEDWGIDKATGKAKIIPHGFDAAFSCHLNNPSSLEATWTINALPVSIRSSYQSAYYRIVKEIFGNSTSLDKMIASVNEFPYNDANKTKLIEYLKIRFYKYSKYFNSEEFAQSIGQTFSPVTISLPFASDSEYLSHEQAFSNTCYRSAQPLSGVTVSVIGTPTLSYTSDYEDPKNGVITKNGMVNYVIEIKTTTSALEVSKSRYRNAFSTSLMGINANNNQEVQFQYSPILGNVENYSGPYYVIPPNSTVRFSLSAYINSSSLMKDNYFVQMYNFKPNNNVMPLPIQSKTNTLNLGYYDQIEITTPKSGEVLNLESQYNISWKGTSNRIMNIILKGLNGYNEWSITNPNIRGVISNNVYPWRVGDVYVYKNSGDQKGGSWEIFSVDPGQYKISVQYSNTNISKDSDSFRINTSSSSTPPTARIIGTSTLSMRFDQDGNENSIVSSFNVAVDAGSRDQMFLKNYAFESSLKNSNNQRAYGSSSYSQPAGTSDNGNGFYVIPANTTAIFTVNTTFNPKIMFAGIYHGILDRITIGNYSNPTILYPTDVITSNSLTVVGEKSPYINSISRSSIPSDQQVTLSGVRFDNSLNTLEIINTQGTVVSSRQIGSTNSGQTITFTPNVGEGFYYVNVTHPSTGKSNSISLMVTKPVPTIEYPRPTQVDIGTPPVLPPTVPISTTPSISLVYPNGGETLTRGSTYNIRWNSTNISNAVLTIQIADSSGNQYMVADGVSNTGSYSWNILSGTPVGRYKILMTAMIDDGAQFLDIQSSDYFDIVTSSSGQTSSIWDAIKAFFGF